MSDGPISDLNAFDMHKENFARITLRLCPCAGEQNGGEKNKESVKLN